MDRGTPEPIPLRIVPDPDDPDCAQVLVEAVVLGPDPRNILGMDLLGLRPWELRFSEETLWIDPLPGRMATHPLISDAGSHIPVEARFDGVSAACVWDTGAGITVVDAGFARAHPALFTLLGMGTGTDSNLATMEAPLATLAGCQIGQLPFSPSKAAIVDLSSAGASADRPIDLILGYPILRQADWRIDVPGQGGSVTRR